MMAPMLPTGRYIQWYLWSNHTTCCIYSSAFPYSFSLPLIMNNLRQYCVYSKTYSWLNSQVLSSSSRSKWPVRLHFCFVRALIEGVTPLLCYLIPQICTEMLPIVLQIERLVGWDDFVQLRTPDNCEQPPIRTIFLWLPTQNPTTSIEGFII